MKNISFHFHRGQVSFGLHGLQSHACYALRKYSIYDMVADTTPSLRVHEHVQLYTFLLLVLRIVHVNASKWRWRAGSCNSETFMA
jgi:hypothetical protein